jgi:hypothetical protein
MEEIKTELEEHSSEWLPYQLAAASTPKNEHCFSISTFKLLLFLTRIKQGYKMAVLCVPDRISTYLNF